MSSAIVKFHKENAKDLKDAAAKHLLVMSNALDLIAANGFKEVRKISSVGYLQDYYDKCRNHEKKRKRDDPMRTLRVQPVFLLREFIKRAKKCHGEDVKRPVTPPPMAVYEEPRCSARVKEGSPSTSAYDSVLESFTDRPPEGAKAWPPLSLCLFVDGLKCSRQKVRPYLVKIVKRGMSGYKHYTAINKLYRKWVKNNKGQPRGTGKPAAVEVPEIVSSSKDSLKNLSHDSSTVKVLHMKEVIASKKKSQAA